MVIQKKKNWQQYQWKLVWKQTIFEPTIMWKTKSIPNQSQINQWYETMSPDNYIYDSFIGWSKKTATDWNKKKSKFLPKESSNSLLSKSTHYVYIFDHSHHFQWVKTMIYTGKGAHKWKEKFQKMVKQ